MTKRSLAGLFGAATVGLLFTAAELTAQRSKPTTVCEREGAKYVRSKPRTLRESEHLPRKVRHVTPAFPGRSLITISDQ